MPTDRLITLNLMELGDYSGAGIYIPGADVLYRRWATLIDTSVDRSLTLGQGGSRAQETALYRTRYFKELASADVRITFLTEDDGDRYRVTRISEVTGRDGNTRRRWLELDCIRADVGSAATPTPSVPVEDTTTDVPMDMIPDFGGLLGAPTFTLLGTVTEGNTADDEVDFSRPCRNKYGLELWRLLGRSWWTLQYDVVSEPYRRASSTALIPIRRARLSAGAVLTGRTSLPTSSTPRPTGATCNFPAARRGFTLMTTQYQPRPWSSCTG